MSKLNVSNIFNENEDGAPAVSGISTFSSPHYFVPPSVQQHRDLRIGEGMIRFNTDSGHLEYYSGEFWVDVIVNNNNLGVSTYDSISAKGTGTRGVIGARATPGFIQDIDYFTIATRGNGTVFGDMSTGRYTYATFGSSVRGVFAGGNGQPEKES